MKYVLFLGSIGFLALGVYFATINNMFFALVSLITASFFSSTRKYSSLKRRIDELEKLVSIDRTSNILK